MFSRFGVGQARFNASYRAYPVSFIDRPQLELGDKVILPPERAREADADANR